MTVPDEDVVRLDLEGFVYHHLPEPKAEEWRIEVRKVARQMNWRIRTGHNRETQFVWAGRTDFEPQVPEIGDEAIVDALERRWRNAQGDGSKEQ